MIVYAGYFTREKKIKRRVNAWQLKQYSSATPERRVKRNKRGKNKHVNNYVPIAL